MNGNDLALSSASALAKAVRDKTVSSVELLQVFLDRIDRMDGPINSVVTLAPDRAFAEAKAADTASARGEWSGPLHGLPITIKDAIETQGIRSTGGAVELRDHVPGADAPAVARLRAAGAVVFGKTNLPRWSFDTQTFNELFGTTNNPWAHDRTPGGSSGGAASAVACGFTSFELGTDIGGSIRLPSHFCGVYGLKPSYAIVSQRGYLDHVGGGVTNADINSFGPIARSSEDLALLLGVLAGPDQEDEAAWRLELPASAETTLGDYRVGTWFDDPECEVDREYLACLNKMADQLSNAGARVEPATPPSSFAEQQDIYLALISAATSVSLPAEVAQQAAISHHTWLQFNERRAALRAAWARWFDRYDILLCPVAASAAYPHDQSTDLMSRVTTINGRERLLVMASTWCGIIGVAYLPSVVAPIGVTPSALPVGVQIVAPYLHDHRAIRFAQLLDATTGGYRSPW